MRTWIYELGRFLFAVLRHWKELVMGSFLMACVWFCQSVFAVPSSGKVYLGIAILFLVLGAFGAWRDERKKFAELEAGLRGTIAEQQREIAQHGTIQQRRLQTQGFAATYIEFAREGHGLVRASGIPTSFNFQLADNILAWQQRVVSRLREEVNQAKWLQYEQIEGPVTAGGYDKQQRIYNECAKLPKQMEFLQQLISDPTAFIRD